MKITFLRHAETENNASDCFSGRFDCNITAEGKLAARNLASESPFSEGFDSIFISPLRRTQQTLMAIYPSANYTISSDIIEIDLGEWEGKPKSSVDQQLRKDFLAGKYMPEGSLDKSHKDVEERLAHFISECRNSGKENILAVTHNGVIRTLKRMYNLEPSKEKNLGYIVLEF